MIAISVFETIAEDLTQVEQKMRQSMVTPNQALSDVLACLLSSGGKRLRPALALLASRLGQAETSKALSLAGAVELLHTATLVHDDLIDNSLLRRGRVTLNAQWSSGATVLAGDLIFAQSASMAAETQNVRVIAIFAQTLVTICQGELSQLFSVPWRQQTKEDYYRRIYAKTASLFAAATEMGGILAGLPEIQLQALREYGRTLGMAFQIIDDVLDFVGDEGTIGKPVGGDLRQGIVTLPTLIYLRQTPQDEGVVDVLDRRGSQDGAVTGLVARIVESGAIQASYAEAEEFVRQGKDALLSLPGHPARAAMLELADYVTVRRT